MILKHSVFGSAAVVTSDSTHRAFGTIGQPLVGGDSSPALSNSGGFWVPASDLVTSVEPLSSRSIPKEFQLEQNYPNPLNPTTTIQFALPKRSSVTLKIFDILGRHITTLVDEEFEPGEYKVHFEAGEFASGVYFYRIQTEEFVRTKKLMLMK